MSNAKGNPGGWRPRGAYSRVGATGNTRTGTPRQRQQRHLLDVRVRTREVSRQRRARLFYWLSAVLLAGVVGGGLYFGATRGIARLFYQNPDYNIATLQVETDGVLSRDQVLDCAGLREGMNIFHVNLDQARERLETLPLVQKVQIQRLLPNKVSITLVERRPIAWIAPEAATVAGKPPVSLSREDVFGSKNSFLVDGSGTLLRPKKFLAQNFDLPIIRGCATDKLAPGQSVDSDEVRAALDLIRAHQNSLLGARFQIQDIDVSRGYGLTVTDRRHTQVFFALEDPELQLRTLESLLKSIDATGKRPATISLATMAGRQRNIPVTFQPEPLPGSVAAAASANSGAAAATPNPAASPSADGKPKAPAGEPPSPPATTASSQPSPPAIASSSASRSSEKPAASTTAGNVAAKKTERRESPRARSEKPVKAEKPHAEEVGGFRGGRSTSAPRAQSEPPVPKAQPVQ